MLANVEKSRQDLRWLFANIENLRQKYANNFIAAKDKEVAFEGENLAGAYAAI
jgi:hypothetical protein